MHNAKGEEVESSWTGVLSIKNTTRELMLCQEHFASLVSPVLECMLDVGAKPDAKPKQDAKPKRVSPKVAREITSEVIASEPAQRKTRKDTPKPCPVKGCGFVAKAGGGLAGHVKSRHPEVFRKAS